MLNEEETRKILERCISDFDKLVAKLDNDDDDISVEMYMVADQLEGATDVLKEVLELKE